MKLVSILYGTLSILIVCLLLFTGCSGGDAPVYPQFSVGEISGPDRFYDNSFPAYSIEAYGDSSITYEWEVSPSGAGYFANAAVRFATFCPSPVSSDTPIEIRVSVKSAFQGSEIRRLNVSVCSTPVELSGELIVSEIIGAAQVAGCSWVTYGVETTGDTGITYQWSVDPAEAGTFTHPESRYTNFTAHSVDEPKSALINLVVDSDNFPPVARTLDITIVPGQEEPGGLSVNNITGPASATEYSTVSYSVIAQGDTGINYTWTVEPEHIGYFDSPESPSTNFTVNPIENEITHSLSAEIQVAVSSDNYGPVIKTRKIAVINDGQIVGWIDSPTVVLEQEEVTYSINVDPYFDPLVDYPFPLRWECDPIYAGTFVVAMGGVGDPDYFISSVYVPEVIFKASEVQYDTPAIISVFYEDEFVDSVDIMILDDYAKTPESHWYEPSGIIGPAEVVETYTDVFYFSVPDGDPDWHYNWSCVVIDDWGNGMPYFGPSPPPNPPGTLEPTLDENGLWTWQIVEFITDNMACETWVEITVDCPGGPHSFITAIRTIPQPCIYVSEIWPPLYWSEFDDGQPSPPINPEKPWFDMTFTTPWGEPVEIGNGDIVRLFVTVDSYFSSDFVRCSWETYPEGVVHFWGDMPFEQPTDIEAQWMDCGNKICDPEYPGLCGSHYYLPGGAMDIVAWVEITSHTSEEFDLWLTLESAWCNTAIRVMRFNEE